MSTRERTYHLIGWTLFLVCALFFIASAAISGDVLYLAGSVIFFLACIAFVIPLVSRVREPLEQHADPDARNTESESSV